MRTVATVDVNLAHHLELRALALRKGADLLVAARLLQGGWLGRRGRSRMLGGQTGGPIAGGASN